MEDEKFLYTKEALKILEDSYNYLDHLLSIIENGIVGGQFAFVYNSLDIVNARVDELEKQVRAMQESNFGTAEILGFFLGPVLGNLLIEPLVMGAVARGLRRLAVNRAIQHEIVERGITTPLQNRPDLMNILRDQINTAYDLTGDKGIYKLEFLFGAKTRDSVGGAINDTSQNIISFATNYVNKKSDIDNGMIKTKKSDAIASMLALMKTNIGDARRNLLGLYTKATAEIRQKDVEIIIGDDTLFEYFEKMKADLDAISKELQDDTMLQTSIIGNINNFLFLSFLGETGLGRMYDREAFVRGDVSDSGETKFILAPNVTKQLLDHLLQNFPNLENSFLLLEITQKIISDNGITQTLKDGLDIINKPSMSDNKNTLLKYYINNPTADPMKYRHYFNPVSLYDRAADKLNTFIFDLKQEMKKNSENIIGNLTKLSIRTKSETSS